MQSALSIPAEVCAHTTRAELVRQARIWVSQTFFGTMLKQMHNSPFRSELFSGGRGGQVFESLLDQRLTERMSRGAAPNLVESIVRRLEARDRQKADESNLLRELNGHVRRHVASAPRD